MTVRRCIEENLSSEAKALRVDASLTRADMSRPKAVLAAERPLPPEAASPAVREYLEVLDDAAFGGATPVVPKYLAPSLGLVFYPRGNA